ncbi:ATP-binding protein [Sphingomonas sp.]|uniref:ATP-binding protein n=1 Tax=Sphingomonas sp. TaxID=28214 RepID=UPI0017A5188B|nr:ATP-binding protein [Sphingomonas sp.]MBA3510772.1 response regulator [Sphingomonas sp.]
MKKRSERALILAPVGRDAAIAAEILAESGIKSAICPTLPGLASQLDRGVGFVLVTEEALLGQDLRGLSTWINRQPEWSDLPFVLLTRRGGGLERNPDAGRFLDMLGNVTFLERPFHPTTLISLARSALRARRRQYDARARLEALQKSEEHLRMGNETLEARVEERTREHEFALAQLHEAQKLETLGQLTGGVAHDFNNLLTPVIGNLDLLRRQLPPEAKQHRLIDGALQAASRAATLVQRLLAFARRQDLQARAVDIGGLIEGMSDLLRRSIGPSVSVEIHSEPDLPAARVDPNQLELAILNLAINGRDAMPSGGTISIECRSQSVQPGGHLQPGDYVCVSVRDTGVGMDNPTLLRAVEPFFSTKGMGQGTGLGLSMIHGLAAQLEGMLDLSSTPGVGTTATIWLPVSSEEPAPAEGEAPRIIPAARRATILLVDDEELVRTGTADMLSDLGYDVVQADSGAEALRLLRSGCEPDLLVTDYLMPGMNGVDLIEHASAIAPRAKALLITGYSDIAEGPGANLPRLQKPFRQGELARRVADQLFKGDGGEVVPFRRGERS